MRRILGSSAWAIGLALAGLVIAVVVLLVPRHPAQALPDFASQTGLPCTACHIGGFGPQLTPTGTAFKIGGYTQSGGQGLQANIPLSAMAIGSFTHTSGDLPSDAVPHHYNDNNNPAWDAASVFIASRTIVRLAPKRPTSSSSFGTTSPGANSPLTMRRPISCTSSPNTPRRRVAPWHSTYESNGDETSTDPP